MLNKFSKMDMNQVAYLMKDGDELALQELINRNYNWIYKKALAMLKCSEDAEDATFGFFNHLWIKKSKWVHDKYKFRTFLDIVCNNFLIDEYRKKTRINRKLEIAYLDETDQEDHSLIEYFAVSKDEPLRKLNAELINDKICDALIQVKRPEIRLAWVLRYIEYYDIKKIAIILKAPEGTIKSWIFRCNKLLRDLLEEFYDENYRL